MCRTKQLLTSLLACVVAAWTANSFAAMIPGSIAGVTGTAFQRGDSPDFGDGSISRALDGSGLTVGDPHDPSTWTHNSRWQDNWQGSGTFTGGATPGAWFVANLGQTYNNLADLYIWNVREVLDRGTKNVDLYYAVSPTVMPATNSAYSFASGGWTLLGNYDINQATGSGTPADSILDLRSIPAAQYIGFAINSNYGSTFRVGFAELEFTVPEPSVLAMLLGAGGLGLFGYVWRRRRS